MKKLLSAIWASDHQIPYQDDRAIAVFEKFLAAHRWDIFIIGGDLIDFDTISSFNIGKPRAILNRHISNDIETANKILDRWQRIVRAKNKEAKFVYLEGNHEERVERWLDMNPQFEGILDVPKLLHLDERGIKWVRSWSKGEIYRIGKAAFIHGNYTNQYHPAKMATKYGDSIFYGHTHDIMCHAVANQLAPEKVHVGQSLGCFCIRDLSYMKGQPSNWQQGFGVFYFLEDGSYTYYTPRIIFNRFVGPDGILYE